MKLFNKLLVLMLFPFVACAANTITMPYEQVIIGKGNASNKTLTFGINSVATSPGIRANDATNMLQFSHDGSTWTDLSAGTSSPLTTKGDIWAYSTLDARFPVSGNNGWVLTEDSTQTFGFKWAAPTAAAGPDCEVQSNTGNGVGAVATHVRRFTTTTQTGTTSPCITVGSTANDGNTYTALTAGVYEVTSTDYFTGNAFWGITVNAQDAPGYLTTSINAIPYPVRQCHKDFIVGAGEDAVTCSVRLGVGDVIRVQRGNTAFSDSFGDDQYVKIRQLNY